MSFQICTSLGARQNWPSMMRSSSIPTSMPFAAWAGEAAAREASTETRSRRRARAARVWRAVVVKSRAGFGRTGIQAASAADHRRFAAFAPRDRGRREPGRGAASPCRGRVTREVSVCQRSRKTPRRARILVVKWPRAERTSTVLTVWKARPRRGAAWISTAPAAPGAAGRTWP